MQPKRIKKGHQMGDIIENENISAYYSMKYSDEEVLLLDDAKLLAKPNPLLLFSPDFEFTVSRTPPSSANM